MRLFISIGFDEKTKDNLMGVMENLKKCSRKGMFYDRENLRLNFLLLHEIDDVSIIKKAVEKMKIEPFNVEFTRIDRSRRDGGDIYWTVAENSSELNDIYSKFRSIADEHGYEYDKKAFKPRVQLGTRVIARPNFKVNEFETKISNITVSEYITSDNGKEVLRKVLEKQL